MKAFEKELKQLINRHCVENASDTPDYILASYLQECLTSFANATKLRDEWYGHQDLSKKIDFNLCADCDGANEE